MFWACSCSQTAELNVDTTLYDYEKQNEYVPLKNILVINKHVVAPTCVSRPRNHHTLKISHFKYRYRLLHKSLIAMHKNNMTEKGGYSRYI